MILRLGSGGATLTSTCKRLRAPAVVVRTPMMATAMDAKARPSLFSVPMALIISWTPSLAVQFLGKSVTVKNRSLRSLTQREGFERNGDVSPTTLGHSSEPWD
jgi:hypothetical protein